MLQYSVNIALYALGSEKLHVTCFIGVSALLQWSGTEPTMSLRCACVPIISLALPQSSFHHVVPDPSCRAKSCFLWKTQPKCYPGCNIPVFRAEALELLGWRWGWTKEARLPHLNQQPRLCSAGCHHTNLFSGLLDPPCFKKHNKKSEFLFATLHFIF